LVVNVKGTGAPISGIFVAVDRLDSEWRLIARNERQNDQMSMTYRSRRERTGWVRAPRLGSAAAALAELGLAPMKTG